MSDLDRPVAPRRRLGSVAMLASLAIALLGTGTVLAQSGGATAGSGGPDQPVVSSPLQHWPVTVTDGAKLANVDPSLVDNELIFPSASTLANAHVFRTLTPDEEDSYNGQFLDAIGA